MRAPNRHEKLTVEALYDMPDDGFRYELQAGLLLSEPLPGFRHGRLVMNFGAMIHEHVKEHRLHCDLRPGDTVDPHEEEIRYGCRLDSDPTEQQKILKEYGVDKPVDYVWVYR